MDVPSASDILLSTSSHDSVSVQIDAQSVHLTNRKRKRSVSEENVENSEETPIGKRVRKIRSKKYKDLPAEVAEEKRRLVNQQERVRQKQIAQAIQRLKNLNLPFNPNVTNHKRDSTMYTISTATDLIIALRKKLKDNGIDPDLHELPSQSHEPVSEQHGAESSSYGVHNVDIKMSQSSAQDLTTGHTHTLGGGKQVAYFENSTSSNYQSSNHNVPQGSNTLVDVSNRQQYLYGNGSMYLQNNKIHQMNQKPFTQTYGHHSVPGLYPGAQIFIAPYTCGPNDAHNNVPLTVQPMARGALNGCHRMSGQHDVSCQSTSLFTSSTSAGAPSLISKPWHATSCPSGEAQARVLSDTPSPKSTLPSNSATAAVTSTPDLNQHDFGNFNEDFVMSCLSDSHKQALINDFINSWMD